MPRNPFWMNTVLCCRNTTSNTTRVTSSSPLTDNFPMMPPLTGLGIGRIVIFYIYAAPTALLAEILRLRNVQTPEFGNPEGSRIPKRFRLKAPGSPRNKRQRRGLPGVAGRNFRNLKEVALGGVA